MGNVCCRARGATGAVAPGPQPETEHDAQQQGQEQGGQEQGGRRKQAGQTSGTAEKEKVATMEKLFRFPSPRKTTPRRGSPRPECDEDISEFSATATGKKGYSTTQSERKRRKEETAPAEMVKKQKAKEWKPPRLRRESQSESVLRRSGSSLGSLKRRGSDSSSQSSQRTLSLPDMMDRQAAPDTELLNALVDSGRVVPCEYHGPSCGSRFHANVAGVNMAFFDAESRREFTESNRKALASYGTWDRLDIAQTNADWAMRYGSQAFQVPFSFKVFKERLERERAAMVAEYAAVVRETSQREPEAYEAMVNHSKYASFVLDSRNKRRSLDVGVGVAASSHVGGERDENGPDNNNKNTGKPRQPTSDLLELYGLSLKALPKLWEVVTTAAETARKKISQDRVPVTWSVKKLMRALSKLRSDYGGDVELLTDVARISVACADLEQLRLALDALLSGQSKHTYRIVSLKNRWAKPVDGYADVLLNLRLEPTKVICEVQLNTAPVYSLKGDSGHQVYKWLRRLVQPDDLYEGGLDEHSKPHGHGRRTFAAGDVYEGAYKNGQKHGSGRYSACDGSYYEGEWVDDKKHGYGCMKFANGNFFEGEFKHGRIDGHGKKTLVDGGCYSGSWKLGKPDGQGEQTFRPGDDCLRYVGAFRQGVKDGRGVMYYRDGSVYSGLFFSGLQHGDGVLQQPDGAVLHGKWSNGTLVAGKLTRQDGTVVEGRFKNGELVNPTTPSGLFRSSSRPPFGSGPSAVNFTPYQGRPGSGSSNKKPRFVHGGAQAAPHRPPVSNAVSAISPSRPLSVR